MFDIVPVTSRKPTDCGATCMKMLLSYYGQDVPLEQLVEECNTKITGCTGKDLIRCGKLHGLDMKAYSATAEDIMESDRPEIVWWMYNHWVIYGGLDEDGKVVIYNPDRGRYRVSKSTFASFFTNISLRAENDPVGTDGEEA